MRRIVLVLLLAISAHAQKFEISFPASAHAQPITGRVFVIIAHRDTPEPRLQAGSFTQQTPIYGADVNQLQPGQTAVIDANTLGFPFKSLKELPAGDYVVQALINIYTEFHRADGHTIWAHMDQWEGQQFNRSPGNLYSAVQKVHLDPAAGYDVKLDLAQEIPAVKVPPDTAHVKRVKLESKLLSQWWGHPIYIGATVLLPPDYDKRPNQRFPVLYIQGHFGLNPPMGFIDEGQPEPERSRPGAREFSQQWLAGSLPRMILVTFQHPTPFFDDSYAVNSANQGPYGDAIMQELIPYLESHFRIIAQPWARALTGGSTGGWESLALQVFHPDFFGGTWTFYPDPVDFHRYQLVDIYNDENAFFAPGFEFFSPERPMMRTPEGQVLMTMRQMSLLEEVLGTHGRSGEQFEEWEAAYGPVGADGYPRPLWDKLTGKIDREVATYMRDHGFDLSYYLQQNWAKLGPMLAGKIHLYCGDMDHFYLNLAVYKLQDVLESVANPKYGGSFQYGRPMKGHGWTPYTSAEEIKVISAAIEKHRPKAAAATH